MSQTKIIDPIPSVELTEFFARIKVQEHRYMEWVNEHPLLKPNYYNTDANHQVHKDKRREFQDIIRDIEEDAIAVTKKLFNAHVLPLPFTVEIGEYEIIDTVDIVTQWQAYLKDTQRACDELATITNLYAIDKFDEDGLNAYYEDLIQGRVDNVARHITVAHGTRILPGKINVGPTRYNKPHRYEFDPSGLSGRNRINELRDINDTNRNEFNFIVPQFAPFFVDNLSISRVKENGQLIPLVINEDYYVSSLFGHISEFTMDGKLVAGTIVFDDKKINGKFLLEYNTLGGQFMVDNAAYAEILASNLPSPYLSDWLSIVGKQIEMPTIPHALDVSYLRGFEDIYQLIIEFKDEVEHLKTAQKQAEDEGWIDKLIEAAKKFNNQTADLNSKFNEMIKVYTDRTDAIQANFDGLADRIRNATNQQLRDQLAQVNTAISDLNTSVNANLNTEIANEKEWVKEKIKENTDQVLANVRDETNNALNTRLTNYITNEKLAEELEKLNDKLDFIPNSEKDFVVPTFKTDSYNNIGFTIELNQLKIMQNANDPTGINPAECVKLVISPFNHSADIHGNSIILDRLTQLEHRHLNPSFIAVGDYNSNNRGLYVIDYDDRMSVPVVCSDIYFPTYSDPYLFTQLGEKTNSQFGSLKEYLYNWRTNIDNTIKSMNQRMDRFKSDIRGDITNAPYIRSDQIGKTIVSYNVSPDTIEGIDRSNMKIYASEFVQTSNNGHQYTFKEVNNVQRKCIADMQTIVNTLYPNSIPFPTNGHDMVNRVYSLSMENRKQAKLRVDDIYLDSEIANENQVYSLKYIIRALKQHITDIETNVRNQAGNYILASEKGSTMVTYGTRPTGNNAEIYLTQLYFKNNSSNQPQYSSIKSDSISIVSSPYQSVGGNAGSSGVYNSVVMLSPDGKTGKENLLNTFTAKDFYLWTSDSTKTNKKAYSVSDALDNLKRGHESLKSTVDSHTTTLNGINSRFNEVNNAIRDANTSVTQANSTIAGHTNQLATLRNDLTSLSGRITNIRDRVQVDDDWGKFSAIRNKAPLTHHNGDIWLGHKAMLVSLDCERTSTDIRLLTNNKWIAMEFYYDTTLNSPGVHFNGIVKAVNVVTTSDRRLKEDITLIDNPMKKVLQLSGYQYTLTSTKSSHYGVIAQEVQEVLPYAVSQDANGDLGVDYHALVALLIETTKIQQQQIDTLTKRIEQLENQRG